ncbi:Hypothetical predicted protein [Scomber scombrus]|uniref:Uncharacterized protein n=1 Tax=Scomber scombrus TaxID=13677 RepID=A0AAV1NU64_SCOSC
MSQRGDDDDETRGSVYGNPAAEIRQPESADRCISVLQGLIMWQGKSETFLLFALENHWAQRAPAASVSSLTRLPQQDVFHAIVDVACWKHNETSMNPNYTSPGTTAALWDMVGADAGKKPEDVVLMGESETQIFESTQPLEASCLVRMAL